MLSRSLRGPSRDPRRKGWTSLQADGDLGDRSCKRQALSRSNNPPSLIFPPGPSISQKSGRLVRRILGYKNTVRRWSLRYPRQSQRHGRPPCHAMSIPPRRWNCQSEAVATKWWRAPFVAAIGVHAILPDCKQQRDVDEGSSRSLGLCKSFCHQTLPRHTQQSPVGRLSYFHFGTMNQSSPSNITITHTQ